MIKRGEIYFVNLDPTKGREQAGSRPVLVVSDDAINQQPLVVAVVVGTDASNIRRDYPTNVRLKSKETGLPLDTVFLCFQLRSLDHQRFLDAKMRPLQPAGTAQPLRMKEIDAALKLTLGLN